MTTTGTLWSRIIDRLGRPRTALILTALQVAVLGIVNGLDFPLSVPYQHRVTGQGYLDFCNYCSATAVQNQVDALGERGRLLQALLLSTIDIVIPTLTCLFGIAVLAALTRRWRARGSSMGWLLAIPVVGMVLDYAENWSIVGLLIRYPASSPVLASLEGVFSGLKVTAYALVAVSIVVLLAINALFRRHTVEVQQ